MNAPEHCAILDKAAEFEVSEVVVNRYYGGRNKLHDKLVSFEYDIESDNKALDDIYTYAKRKKINLLPANPRYWKAAETVIEWDEDNYDKNKRCYEPWKSIHFNPVLDDKNCHYVGVCNRIELFKLRYETLELRTQTQFYKLWNHPVLQYMRSTVNSDQINPVCRYCKNYDREALRNTYPEKYAAVRDKAVRSFFAEFMEKYSFESIQGLHILQENPHSDEKFREKLQELGC